jgi:hypothetical protein
MMGAAPNRMRLSLVLLAGLLLGCASAGGLPVGEGEGGPPSQRGPNHNLLENGDFETGGVDDFRPWGGFVHANGERYSFQKRQAFAHSGRFGVEIRQLQPEEWGVLTQFLETRFDSPVPYRMSAALRGHGVVESVLMQVVIRQPGQQQQVKELELPADEFGADWLQRSFELTLPAGRADLMVGIVLNGGGALWIDDVELVPLRSREPISSETLDRRRDLRRGSDRSQP